MLAGVAAAVLVILWSLVGYGANQPVGSNLCAKLDPAPIAALGEIKQRNGCQFELAEPRGSVEIFISHLESGGEAKDEIQRQRSTSSGLGMLVGCFSFERVGSDMACIASPDLLPGRYQLLSRDNNVVVDVRLRSQKLIGLPLAEQHRHAAAIATAVYAATHL